MTNGREFRAKDLPLNEWQIKEIEKGLEEAKAGDFLTEEEVAEAYRRWLSPRGGEPPQ